MLWTADMTQGTRTIGLWLLLIVLFVGFYNFLSPTSRLPSWSGWVMVVVFIAFIVLSRSGGARARQGVQLNAEGSRLMSQGRIALALEKFEAARPLLERSWKTAIALNIGLCQLELWRLDAAELEFNAALASTLKLPEDFRRLLLPRHALVAALRGDLQGAVERSATAREVEPEAPLLVLTEGVLACRRGEWRHARTLLEGPATHVLGGPLRGLRDALLCWSVEHTSGEHRTLELVTVFGEASPDKLRESWPQLVAFLLERSHGTA